jgi:hypothetical protein
MRLHTMLHTCSPGLTLRAHEQGLISDCCVYGAHTDRTASRTSKYQPSFSLRSYNLYIMFRARADRGDRSLL